jgi:hypothetical protein
VQAKNDDLWYTCKEYDNFRNESRMIAVSIRQRYSGDHSDLSSYGGALMAAYKSCLVKKFPCEEIVRQLVKWLTVGVSRRGLEKQSVRAIYDGRREAIKRSIFVVLSAQNFFRDSKEKEERIRQLYEEVTTPSRLFARVLAQADMLAVDTGSITNTGII